MDFDKLRQYLNVIKISVDKIEQLMGDIPIIDAKELLSEAKEAQKAIEQTKEKIKSTVNPFDLDVIAFNDKWPEAVPPYAISEESETGHKKRAKGILDSTNLRSIDGNFLDFGCGDGFITAEAAKRGASLSLGYDIEEKETWKGLRSKNVKFITSFKEIGIANLKFDNIFIYDVLDHAENQKEIMAKVKKVLSDDGTIYIRCHPYTSKHATHVYKKINKAFVHLFASEEDINNKVESCRTFITLDPLKTYAEWFDDFKVVSEKIIREPVHEFFLRSDIKKYLGNIGLDNRKLQLLEIQFVDYILRNK